MPRSSVPCVRRALRALVLAVLAGAPSLAAAQLAPRDTAPVPRELAELLFGMGYGAREIVVGRPPSGFPSLLALPDARALGGMGGPSGGEAIFEVAGGADSVVDELRARLEQGGWERLQFGRQSAARGFVGTGWAMEPPQQYCRERLTVHVRPDRRMRRAYVRVGWTEQPRNQCEVMRANVERAAFGGASRMAEIPSLQPPTGVEVMGGGSGSGGDSWHTSGRATGAASGVSLLDHYVGELREVGWTLGTRQAGDTLAAAVLHRAMDDGQPWIALLTVLAEPKGSGHALLLRAGREGGRW